MNKPSCQPAANRQIGLIGLGRMGAAMATRLLGAGHELAVWNRSRTAAAQAEAQGAHVKAELAELFRCSDAVLLVLANAEAADSVLGRTGTALAVDVAGRLVIQLGTTLPSHSLALAEAISANGGRYVEAPVSGSRVPAEQGRLIAMLGGSSERDLTQAEAILKSLAAKCVRVGPPPMAMRMKLAVNALTVPLVFALSEAWGLAEGLGLDMRLFAEVLNEGSMASDFSRGKLAKLLEQDWTAQASINDVLMNTHLIATAARDAGAPASLVTVCESLLRRAQQSGHGALDAVAASSLLR